LLYYIVVYTFAKQLNDDDDNEDRIVFMCWIKCCMLKSRTTACRYRSV